MRKRLLTFINAGVLGCLSACAGVNPAPGVPVQPAPAAAPSGGAFQRADADSNGALNYTEYRVYSDLKAADDYAERELRAEDSADGNYLLQKRFMVLDRDHNWQLSRLELGGG